jgi:hypothetical protein
MKTLVNQMFIQLAQCVIRELVSHVNGTFVEFGGCVQGLKMIEIIRRLGHLPGREFGKQDLAFFLEVWGAHLQS